MDVNIQFQALIALAGAVVTFGTAWLTIRKINKEYQKDRLTESAKILQLAKEADERLKTAWESKRDIMVQEINSKINSLEDRLENLEQSVAKDFAHVRETYNGEIRNLGDKIEDLRSELRNQHGQLVQLLTKMIDRD